MNILFVVPYVPSLIRTRSYNLIRALSARGHRVTVATAWSTAREQADAAHLATLCHRVDAVHLPQWRSLVNCVLALPHREPLQSRYSWSPELLSRLRATLADVDVVHVEHLRGVRYAMAARAGSSRRPVPVVWDSVDCITHLFEQAAGARADRVGRWLTRLELGRTRQYEAWACDRVDRVVISSEIDRRALVALRNARSCEANGPSTARFPRVTVIPNGVDTVYFSPNSSPREAASLVFSGKMSYHANVAAAAHLLTDIMPLVWARLPHVHLTLAGKDPPAMLRELAARHGAKVTVTGTVPDVRPYLQRATAAVIPLVYGAGSQFKVLEAMACATPVVATSRAVAALEIRPGRDVVVADGPQAFAASLLALLQDGPRARALGQSGRAYVEGHHRWERIAEQLEAVYGEEVEARHGAAGRSRLQAGAPQARVALH